MPNRRLAATGALVTAAAVVLIAPSRTYAAADGYALAPYTDMSNSQEGMLDTAITQHGLGAYTAAFVLGSGCNQIWGDTLPVGDDPYTDREIARAMSEGASVIISFGGGASPICSGVTDPAGAFVDAFS